MEKQQMQEVNRPRNIHFILSGFVSFGYMWNTFSELPFSQGFIGLSFILCNLTDVHNIPF